MFHQITATPTYAATPYHIQPQVHLGQIPPISLTHDIFVYQK